MTYPEDDKSCDDRYEYPHENACCYRAEIFSLEEDGTYTVQWETPPSEIEATTAGIILDYSCGWCLAPFLQGHAIKPFCKGSHVLVLDNHAEADRFLIVGFDDKYTDVQGGPLLPCIPDNLGLYFTNAKYGAPYGPGTPDENGQTICYPVNPWTEDIIEIPRGTENNSGKMITIATGEGEITAIKEFQVPGFAILSNFSQQSGDLEIKRGFYTSYSYAITNSIANSEVTFGIIIVIRSKCIISGNILKEQIFTESLPAGVLGAEITYINFYSNGEFGSHNSFIGRKDDSIKAIVAFQDSPEITITATITEDADGYPKIDDPSISIGARGSYQQTVTTDNATAEFGNGTITLSKVIEGESILLDFGISKVVNCDITKTTTISGGAPPTSNQTIITTVTRPGSFSARYVIPDFTWTNISTFGQDKYSELTYQSSYGTLNQIVGHSNDEQTVHEEYSYLIAIDIARSFIIRFRVVVDTTLIATTTTTGFDTTGPTDISMSFTCYLEYIYKGNIIVLEEYSDNATTGTDKGDMLWSVYLAPLPDNYTEGFRWGDELGGTTMSSNRISDGTYYRCGSLALWPPDAPHLSPIVSGQYVSVYRDHGLDMLFIGSREPNGFPYQYYPLVNTVCALDKRQVKLSYRYNGILKERYFVDNVEWTKEDILNR